MRLRTILTTLRIPHLATHMKIARDSHSFLRLNFLNSAIESGLLTALSEPATKEKLIQALGAQRPELLEGLLDVGVSLGELSRSNGVYSIRGKRSRTLLADNGDPIAALIQEYVTYHGSVYSRLAERLKGAPLGDYLERTADMVARSSRVVEPVVGDYVRGVIRRIKPMRMLEIGCGSGIYLRYAVEANPNISGIAIDMQETVVKGAVANLSKWGIGDRFKVVVADIRNPHPDLAGPFDLISLYNNIYYFPPADRPELFKKLRSRLSAKGGLAIVSLMKGATPTAANFDLVLKSTVGCWPIPEMEELVAQLKDSGFAGISKDKLALDQPFYGVLAE